MNLTEKTALHPARKDWDLLWRTGLLIPVLFLTFLIWRAPHLDPHDWDYDEGINLMKAMLYGQGYSLYSEVWSDQPPLMTVTLAGVFSVLGAPDVAAARLLIMLLSALLLWCLYLSVHATSSTLASVLAVLLLVLSQYYIRLSGAVMIGLPSLALATLSVTFLVTGRLQWWRVVVSAVAMALALQTKLMAAVVAPAALVAVVWGSRREPDMDPLKMRLLKAIVWGSVLGIAFLFVGLLLQSLRFDLLLGSHLNVRIQQHAVVQKERWRFLSDFLNHQVPYLVLAGAGVVCAVWRRKPSIVVPLAWYVTALAALSVHRPVWYHHVVLLNVPLAWLCAFGIDGWIAGVRGVTRGMPSGRAVADAVGLAVSALAVLGLFFFYPAPLPERQYRQITQFRPLYVPSVAKLLATEAGQSPSWVFTDHPFYAFQAGVPVPPPIAVLSSKSLEIGIITWDLLLDVLKTFRPRYVLLERFAYHPIVIDEINANYTMVFEVPLPSAKSKYFRRLTDDPAPLQPFWRSAWSPSSSPLSPR